MNSSEITVRTIYSTADGKGFSSMIEAEHHVKVCNVLHNCFFHPPLSIHYQTIWELLKHHKIVDRDDEEYEKLCDSTETDNVLTSWFSGVKA